MSPIPFHVGTLKFTIKRKKSGLNKFHPKFELFIEKHNGSQVMLLFGKKRAFNKTANYLISMDKSSNERDNATCLGKLRANKENDRFILYDNGENFEKKNTY